jgi:HEAT repeat protein
MLVYALLRVKKRREETARTLIEMIDDPHLTVQIIDALGSLKAEEAIPTLSRFASSSDPNHRREARKALKKLGCLPQHQATKPSGDEEAFVETSGNFDRETMASFLEKTSVLTRDQLQELDQVLDSLDVEEEAEVEFLVPTADGQARLKMRIFMGDIDAPDIQFRSTPDVVDQLERGLR